MIPKKDCDRAIRPSTDATREETAAGLCERFPQGLVLPAGRDADVDTVILSRAALPSWLAPVTCEPRFAVFFADGKGVWEYTFGASPDGNLVMPRGWAWHEFGCETVTGSGHSAPPEVYIAAGVEALRRAREGR